MTWVGPANTFNKFGHEDRVGAVMAEGDMDGVIISAECLVSATTAARSGATFFIPQ